MSAINASAPDTKGVTLQVTPGPRPGLVGGHLMDFNRNPLGFLARCARQYGDIVALRFANFPIYLVNNPEAIKAILVTNNRSFVKGRGLGRTRDILGNGLLTSEGEFWRRQRRLAQPAFHQQRIAAYGEIMRERTRRMLATWKDGQALDVHERMMDLTMEIVAQALFNADLTGEADTVRTSMNILLKDFSERNRQFLLPDWFPSRSKRRLEQSVHSLDSVVYGIIQQRRQNPGTRTGDLLDMLLEARDEDGSGMSDQQLRDEVMTLFLAGHETTANAISWTLMLLSQHPEAEARLHAELDAVLGGREPGLADLPQLPYASHVISEGMRLFPPAWVIGRQPVQDVDIGGVTLPAGAGILMSQWVMHRDPRYYEHPEAFIPERWEGDFARNIPEFAYFPFGGGPRLCIGKPFALQEAVLVLAMISIFWATSPVIGLALAAAAFLFAIVVDNISARLTWA
ncbi:MAG: cytochrome P450, partial [Chloroflexi bacterium]|nr:cytochrome P450 [Chloroflexota bacterium]